MNLEKNEIPQFLISMLENQYGSEICEEILKGYKVKRKVTFRVNTLKNSIENIEKKLNEINIIYKKIEWYEDAFIIENINESDLRELDIYKNGEIYLQSLSSMIPPIVLKPEQNKDILDMAAAPGGKTTEMATLSQNKAHITACEVNQIRAERLKYNLEKQGAKCVYLMQKDARCIDDFFSFDQILLDAPCSGSGTLNINDVNLDKFTEKLIDKSIKLQLGLLRKAVKILKPGCEMVYSTCSILKEENEDILNNIIKENKDIEIIPIELANIDKIPLLPTMIEGTMCVKPNELYEGFFVAKLRKKK